MAVHFLPWKSRREELKKNGCSQVILPGEALHLNLTYEQVTNTSWCMKMQNHIWGG